MYNLGGGSPTAGLAAGQKLIDDIKAKPAVQSNVPFIGNIAKTASKQGRANDINNITKALQALTGISGIFGSPKTTQKVTTSSKKSTKS